VVSAFPSVFSPPSALPPSRPSSDYRIVLDPNRRPDRPRPPYKLSDAELVELRRQLDLLLARGWITPTSFSSHACPVFFVKKKDGSLRLVVDWRPLNKLTIPNAYPLPDINRVLSSLHGASVFSTIDLAQSFHQLRTHPDSARHTVMTTAHGLFRWNVLSFGQTDAPAACQALLDRVLRGLPFAKAYLDDIVIFSKSIAEHAAHVRAVLQRLKDYQLHANVAKCHFAYPSITFLGHVVSADGVRPDPDKLRAVQDWPAPTSVTETRAFLGLASYLRRHISQFATLARPLHRLTRTDVPFAWSPTAQEAFDTLKAALTSPPVLAFPNPALPYVIEADASSLGLGATLLQAGKVVEYASRSLSDREARLCTRDRELEAVVFACKRWRHFLHTKPVTIVTDHKPLLHLQLRPGVSTRVANNATFLAQFRLSWEHRPGAKLALPDALSRCPLATVSQTHTRLSESARILTIAVATVESEVQGDPALTAALQAAYPRDPTFGPVWEVLRQPDPPASSFAKRTYFLRDGLLYTNALSADADGAPRLCVPKDRHVRGLLLHTVHSAHTGAHPGRRNTVRHLGRRFFWPGLSQDVTSFVRSCTTCQRVKADHRPRAGLLHPPEPATSPWTDLSVDFCEMPAADNGQDFILVVVDRCTKRVRLLPCAKTIDAPGAAALFVDHIVPLHGVPRSIIGDRDPRWTADFWSAFWTSLGTNLRLSTAAHPQTDGQTERAIQTVKAALRAVSEGNPRSWPTRLGLVEFALNNQLASATGFSPFFAELGRHPRSPVDALTQTRPTPSPLASDLSSHLEQLAQVIHDNALLTNTRDATRADRHRREHVFTPGTQVLVKTSALLRPADRAIPAAMRDRFSGPFVVTQSVGDNAVRLALPAGYRAHNVINVDSVKVWHRDEWPERSVAPLPPVPAGTYAVDHIVRHRGRPASRRYLVRWAGYDAPDDTWEPANSFRLAGNAVCSPFRDYLLRHNLPLPSFLPPE